MDGFVYEPAATKVDGKTTALSNDLIDVIGHYTAATATLRLLTIAGNASAYKPWFWRQKALVETRGLVHTDRMITDWYSYYLLRRKNIHGVIDLPVGEIRVRHVYSTDDTLIIQDDELSLLVFNRSARSSSVPKQALVHRYPFSRLVVSIRLVNIGKDSILYTVDERGEVLEIRSWLRFPLRTRFAHRRHPAHLSM